MGLGALLNLCWYCPSAVPAPATSVPTDGAPAAKPAKKTNHTKKKTNHTKKANKPVYQAATFQENTKKLSFH